MDFCPDVAEQSHFYRKFPRYKSRIRLIPDRTSDKNKFPITRVIGTYFYRNTERRNPEAERDWGQKGSYNKVSVIAFGSNAPHGQAGKSSYKMETVLNAVKLSVV